MDDAIGATLILKGIQFLSIMTMKDSCFIVPEQSRIKVSSSWLLVRSRVDYSLRILPM